MGSKLKAPPQFNPEEDTYERWKEDIAIWEMFSDLDKPKQAQAIYLSLTGKAKEAVRDVKASDLARDGID